MICKSITDRASTENTYLVYEENSRQGVIIDPGCSIDRISNLIEENNAHISFILLTHCHFDHIRSVEELRRLTGAPIVASPIGLKNLTDVNINLSVKGLGYPLCPKPNVGTSDGGMFYVDVKEDGKTKIVMGIKSIHTPGHTTCSVCYLIEDHLFCGDTLFRTSVGKWDFPTGSHDDLEKSIREKLYVLPDDVIVHPGHGKETTIGYEKKYNICVPL